MVIIQNYKNLETSTNFIYWNEEINFIRKFLSAIFYDFTNFAQNGT